MTVNFNKHVSEGWTVGDFITDLQPLFDMIMRNRSHIKPFTSESQVREWVKDNQPHYKRPVAEVNAFFVKRYKDFVKC